MHGTIPPRRARPLTVVANTPETAARTCGTRIGRGQATWARCASTCTIGRRFAPGCVSSMRLRCYTPATNSSPRPRFDPNSSFPPLPVASPGNFTFGTLYAVLDQERSGTGLSWTQCGLVARRNLHLRRQILHVWQCRSAALSRPRRPDALGPARAQATVRTLFKWSTRWQRTHR